jgi:cytochrome c-type biogenesis protein
MSILAFMEVMGTSSFPLLAAFFIGLMTAISPCPLATNITAIAYVSKKLDSGKHTILVGIFYTLGRMFTYVVVASLIVWFGLNMQFVSLSLQKYGSIVLGPLLIVIGIVMLDIIKMNKIFRFKDSVAEKKSQLSKIKETLAKKGLLGSFLLGIIFAMAFCPFSAVLFFGMLIPIAIKAGDGIIIPSIFALATGLPVIIFAFILAYGIGRLGNIMNKVQTFEKWTRKIAAIVFVIIGVYYTLKLFFI